MIYKMKLNEEPFEKIKNGTKTIEFRIYDKKRQQIKIGDQIEFSKLPDLYEKLVVDVVELYRDNSFENLFRKLYTDEDEINKKIKSIYKHYSPEEEKEYGVLGIKINLVSNIFRYTYNKLVRDKIPENIDSEKGRKSHYRILNDNEYITELNKKILEEANEFIEENSIEELGDLMEVIYAIMELKNYKIEEVHRVMKMKAEKKGAFRNKVYLEYIDENSKNIKEEKELNKKFRKSGISQEIEEAIKNTSEEKESKINWTNAWSKKYPILATYQNEVDIPQYAFEIRKILNNLTKEYGFNELDSMLVLKDILYHIWKDKK